MSDYYQTCPIAKPEPRKKVKARLERQPSPCPVCGRLRTTREKLIRKTCSAKCGYTHRKLSGRSPYTCTVCGAKFFGSGTTVPRKFCTRRCYNAFKASHPTVVSIACAQCGGAVRRKTCLLKRAKKSFCSQECKRAYFVGENSPQFRGDKDPNRGANWNRLAESIRREHGYKCGRCEKTQEENGQKLSVDHIRPWRSFTDKALANAKENLVPLCRKCHSYKTATVERMWLRGDVQGWQAWVRSLTLKSAATFGKGYHDHA